MSTETVISSLHPAFLPIARRALDIARGQMQKGFTVEFTDGFRQPADQAADVAAGASKVPTSWHEYGLAVDFSVFDAAGKYITDGSHPMYKAAGYAMKSNISSLIWGGDWNHPDPDHIEWHPGFTMVQYQAWLATHPAPPVPA